MAADDIIQTLWIGPLSTMERLAVASFVAHGHEMHLYSYDEPADLPAGVVHRDAEEILPYSWRVRDSRGTYSGFANAFRYKLLLERGGWWVDTDVVCLKPFDFPDDLIFAREPDGKFGNAVIRAPAGHELMGWLWDHCPARTFAWRRRLRRPITWGGLGPSLFGEGIKAYGLSNLAYPPEIFYPVDWPDWQEVLKPEGIALPQAAHALHLWNVVWTRKGGDKDAVYPPDSVYEQLKRRYLG